MTSKSLNHHKATEMQPCLLTRHGRQRAGRWEKWVFDLCFFLSGDSINRKMNSSLVLRDNMGKLFRLLPLDLIK